MVDLEPIMVVDRCIGRWCVWWS